MRALTAAPDGKPDVRGAAPGRLHPLPEIRGREVDRSTVGAAVTPRADVGAAAGRRFFPPCALPSCAAAQVLANLTKSDSQQRTLQDPDRLMAVTRDEKFVTARHSPQS